MSLEFVAVRLDAGTFAAVQADPDGALQVLEAAAPKGAQVINLDRYWHGIHVVLTGEIGETGTELGSVIMGGEPVGTESDAPRLLTPDDVVAAAGALAPITDDYFRELYAISDLTATDVYPVGGWTDEHVLDEGLLPHYRRLRAFFTAAATAGEAVIAHVG